MDATISLDKAGRLVVPKEMREALHLRAGEPLKIEQQDDAIVIRRESHGRGLICEEGVWVYDGGAPTNHIDVIQAIEEDRERRMRYLSGESDEP